MFYWGVIWVAFSIESILSDLGGGFFCITWTGLLNIHVVIHNHLRPITYKKNIYNLNNILDSNTQVLGRKSSDIPIFLLQNETKCNNME